MYMHLRKSYNPAHGFLSQHFHSKKKILAWAATLFIFLKSVRFHSSHKEHRMLDISQVLDNTKLRQWSSLRLTLTKKFLKLSVWKSSFCICKVQRERLLKLVTGTNMLRTDISAAGKFEHWPSEPPMWWPFTNTCGTVLRPTRSRRTPWISRPSSAWRIHMIFY